jgi:FixJ family two-component response regulator
MKDTKPTVFLVDDDGSVRRALARLLKSAGLAVKAFASAREFLEQEVTEKTEKTGKGQVSVPSVAYCSNSFPGPGCLVLDLEMPGQSGLELQHDLTAADCRLPIIFITGHGNIPASVQAMKAGAVDFLTKPIDAQVLLDGVRRAVARDKDTREHFAERQELRDRMRTLTHREREVFALVVTGMANKRVAAALGTVEKTVKVHRGRAMRKMGAHSLAELVRMADKSTDPG